MKKTLFTLLASVFILAGCASLDPVPQAMIDSENLCFKEVAKAQIAEASASSSIKIVEFKDERNYVMALAIEKLGNAATPVQVSSFIPCTLTVQAYLRESGAAVRSANAITQKAVGAIGVVGGIWAGGEAISSILGAGVGATTYTNSNVANGSENSIGNVTNPMPEVALPEIEAPIEVPELEVPEIEVPIE